MVGQRAARLIERWPAVQVSAFHIQPFKAIDARINFAGGGMRPSPPRQQSPDVPSGIRPMGTRVLRMARALNNRHEPTSAELKLARHMAQDGASMAEIHAALGWDCDPATTKKRLKKFNIFTRVGSNTPLAAKFGGNTSLPPAGDYSGHYGLRWRTRRLAPA